MGTVGVYLSERSLELTCMRKVKSELKTDKVASFKIDKPGELSTLWQQFLMDNKIVVDGKLITCLSRDKAIVRCISIPSTEKEEIKKMVGFEIDEISPYKLGEYVSDYLVMGNFVKGYTKVMLIIVHKDIVDNQLSIFDQAGLSPDIIDLSSVALFNCFIYKKGIDIIGVEEGKYLLLNLGLRDLDIVMVNKGKLSSSRGVSFEEDLSVSKLLSEIRKSLMAYKKEWGETFIPFKQVLLSGGRGDLKKIADFIEKEFSAKVDVDDTLSISEGLALRGEKRDLPGVNLLPENIKMGKEGRERQKRFIRTGVLSGLLIILVFSIGLLRIKEEGNYLSKLNEQIKGIEKEARLIQDERRLAQSIRSWMNKGGSSLEVLTELCKVVPRGISFERLLINSEGHLTLCGQAKDSDKIYTFTSKLEESSHFRNVEIKHTSKRRIGGKEGTDFELHCLLSVPGDGDR